MDVINRISLLVFVLIATCNLAAEQKFSKQDLNEAYKEYQAAQQGSDIGLLVKTAKQASEISNAVLGTNHKTSAALAYNYAQARNLEESQKSRSEKDMQSVAGLYEDVLELYEDLYGDNAIELIDPLMDLGRIYITGSLSAPKARKHYKAALSVADEIEEDPNLIYASLALEAGMNLYAKTELSVVTRMLEDAHEIYSKHLKEDDARLVEAAFWYGKALYSERKLRQAEKHLVTVYDAYKNLDKLSEERAMTTASVLVNIYERIGESEKSNQFCQAIGAARPWSDNQEQRPIFLLEPAWPISALRNGKEGSVRVSFIVDKNGFVKDPEVVGHEGYKGFRKPAKEVLKKWRFAPKFVDGEPVEAKTTYTMEFVLSR